MGLFDKLNNLFNSSTEQVKQTQNIDRRNINPTEIDSMQRIPASDSYRQKIYKKYYRSYPEMPFISMDREKNTNWIEQAEIFPEQSIIPRSIMTRFSDGLLPGHVYMLYWISNNNRKRIPSYFEYKYGIDFEKEKNFLDAYGFLKDGKITEKGSDAISRHIDIIEAHTPEATSVKKAKEKFQNSDNISIEQESSPYSFTITPQQSINNRNLMLVAPCDRDKILNDLTIINELLSVICSQFKIPKSIHIPVKDIIFNNNLNTKLYSYFQYDPLTPKGKSAKFPLELYISTKNSSNFECFGNVGYMQDNRMGSATLNFWIGKNGYFINLGMENDLLTAKKIEHAIDGRKTTIYKK